MGILKDYQTKGGRCYRRVSVQFSLLYTVRPHSAAKLANAARRQITL